MIDNKQKIEDFLVLKSNILWISGCLGQWSEKNMKKFWVYKNGVNTVSNCQTKCLTACQDILQRVSTNYFLLMIVLGNEQMIYSSKYLSFVNSLSKTCLTHVNGFLFSIFVITLISFIYNTEFFVYFVNQKVLQQNLSTVIWISIWYWHFYGWPPQNWGGQPSILIFSMVSKLRSPTAITCFVLWYYCSNILGTCLFLQSMLYLWKHNNDLLGMNSSVKQMDTRKLYNTELGRTTNNLFMINSILELLECINAF